jgi:hypothetical protein
MQQPPNQEYPQHQWQQQNTSWGSSPQWQQAEPLPPQYSQQIPPSQQQWQQQPYPPQQGTAYPEWQQQPQQYLYPQQFHSKQQLWQQLPMQSFALQQPPKKRHTGRNLSIGFGAIVIFVILIVIIITAGSHIMSRMTSTPRVSTPIVTPKASTPSPYPQLASSYSGNIQNTSNGFSSTLRLDSITEDQQGDISGIILIANPTDGGNTFNGLVGKDNSITFSATITYISSPVTFTGSVNQDGSLSGISSVSGDTNPTNRNTWKLWPIP